MPECLKADRVRILSSPGRRYCEYRYQTLEGTGYEHLHDLIGPAIDALDASIDVGAGNRVLEHVAVPSEELQALVDRALLQLGANLLGKGDMAQRLLGNLQVDIGHTRNTLNWTPPISVDEGMRRAVAGLGP